MSYRHVESKDNRIAIVTREAGPCDGDNYTILLWDDGAAFKTHSYHVAAATALANDWVYDSHGGVYVSILDL